MTLKIWKLVEPQNNSVYMINWYTYHNTNTQEYTIHSTEIKLKKGNEVISEIPTNQVVKKKFWVSMPPPTHCPPCRAKNLLCTALAYNTKQYQTTWKP